ncbi:hypothetical protein FIBSPDRAFT_1046871 [Athelia psychrophila]|uniref:BTB domain-containing protein n=1 Tax=Athelia psychrophila TaxID=1759441 RepID=A0A166G0H7_9AGAM|nr:hypothetical protein FIBSPDRAFT_1046871 [Fibularhizoctonia sp. CBS 109695]
MNSPTSTTFDLSDTESSGAPSRPPSPAPTFNSRHYIRDDVAIFKVANQLFRIHRTLLDEETDMIPRGEDPIELTNIKPGDFEILLDFLNLGTRHDKKPLTVVDWASVIAVSSIYGMQRVLNLACKSVMDQQKTLLDQQETLLDQQKILSDGQKILSDQQQALLDQQQAFLDQQKAFLDQQNAPLNVSCAGVGFERETYGMYFLIREKGTTHYLHTYWASNTEGTQVQLRDRENALNVFNGVFNSMVFFIDKYGALHHAASGLAVDIVDDVPVLRCNRPSSSSPNPWSRPLPEFSFVNSQNPRKIPQ